MYKATGNDSYILKSIFSQDDNKQSWCRAEIEYEIKSILYPLEGTDNNTLLLNFPIFKGSCLALYNDNEFKWGYIENDPVYDSNYNRFSINISNFNINEPPSKIFILDNIKSFNSLYEYNELMYVYFNENDNIEDINNLSLNSIGSVSRYEMPLFNDRYYITTNGYNSYIELNFQLPIDFTVSFLVSRNGDFQYYKFGIGGSCSDTYNSNDYTWFFGIYNNYPSVITSQFNDMVIDSDSWYLFTYVVDRSNTGKIYFYLNDKKSSITLDSSIIDNDNYIRQIAGFKSFSDTYARNLKISEIRLYDGILNYADIYNIYRTYFIKYDYNINSFYNIDLNSTNDKYLIDIDSIDKKSKIFIVDIHNNVKQINKNLNTDDPMNVLYEVNKSPEDLLLFTTDPIIKFSNDINGFCNLGMITLDIDLSNSSYNILKTVGYSNINNSKLYRIISSNKILNPSVDIDSIDYETDGEYYIFIFNLHDNLSEIPLKIVLDYNEFIDLYIDDILYNNENDSIKVKCKPYENYPFRKIQFKWNANKQDDVLFYIKSILYVPKS